MERYLHNSLKKSILTLIGLVLLCMVSWGQILTFDFAGLAGSEASSNSNYNDINLVNSTITRGVGLTAALNADRFNATNWALTSIANAVSGNNYMEFTITPNVGYQFDVSSIVISMQRSSTGPSGIAIRNSLDGYSTNLDAEKSIVDNTSTQTFTFTFTQPNSSSAVFYRVYMWAEAVGGSGGIGDFTGNDIIVNGTVSSSSTPSISVSPSTLSSFIYVVGSGPSASQSYNLSGSNLTGAPGNITVTGSANYEVSIDNITFFSSVNVAYATSTLASTPIYVRLKAGLAANTYNGETISNAGGGATTQNVTCNGSVTVSQSSDVIPVASSEAASVSSIINTAGPLTILQGTQVWQFTIRDGGGVADADNLPTIVNSIRIANANAAGLDWATAIQSIDLFDGITNVGSIQNGSASLTSTYADFTGLTINVADNTNKTITVKLTLSCPLGTGNTDGDYIRFSISSANFTTASSATSSQKSAFAAAQSSAIAPRNDISVVSTQLVFTQQPTTSGVGATMTPFITIAAIDICGNIDKDFTGNVTLTSTGTMTGSPITIAAVSGVATFNSIIHTVAGIGLTLSANTGGLTGATSNNFDIFVVTNFQRGDFAVLAVNSNISCLGVPYSAGDDEISFMIFKDINPGDVFIITDNGYERQNAGLWGNTEGTYQITRTTSSIPSGTVITIRLLNNSPYFEGVYPDNNWTMSNIGWAGTTCVLNSGGDQIYFMQGGTWNKGTSSGSHDASYTPGVVLYAFNTNTTWTSFANSTQQSGLLLGMECFFLMPGTATDYIEYTGPITPATKHDWLNRLNTVANWTDRVNCATFNSFNVHFGQTYSVINGGYNDGIWTGEKNIDWFDCGNWQNLDVPSSTTNVSIPNAGVTFEPTIGAPPTTPVLYTSAECNNISIESSRTLTINDPNSIFDIYGDIVNDGTFSHTDGLVRFYGANTSLTTSTSLAFYNAEINKTLATNILSLNNSFSVNNNFTLTNGLISTGANSVIINNSLSTAIVHLTGSASFINGNLQRTIATNTSTYEFPIGDGIASTNYKRLDFVNSNITGTTSLLANVNTINEIGNNIDSRLIATQSGSALTNVFENAEWNVIPNIAATGGSYGVRLYVANTGISASDDNMFCPVKRVDTSTDYADWNSFESTTTIPITNAAGRIYNSGNGYSERLGFTSFSKFAIARSSSYPLPISLNMFSGKFENKGILLNWQTASELNNNYFEIFKSKDLLSFYKIGTVVGSGTSNNINNYEFFDDNPLNELNYYKLNQVDFDGKNSESNVISVFNDKKSNLIIVLNNNVLDVISNRNIIKAEIYNSSGNRINLININSNFANINLNNLAKGIYLIKFISNDNFEFKKIVIN